MFEEIIKNKNIIIKNLNISFSDKNNAINNFFYDFIIKHNLIGLKKNKKEVK